MGYDARIPLPGSNGIHWVPKSHIVGEMWLQISLSKCFQSACFQDILVKTGKAQTFCKSVSRFHHHHRIYGGWTRIRGSVATQGNSPTGSLHQGSSPVERTWWGLGPGKRQVCMSTGVLLASVSWLCPTRSEVLDRLYRVRPLLISIFPAMELTLRAREHWNRHLEEIQSADLTLKFQAGSLKIEIHIWDNAYWWSSAAVGWLMLSCSVVLPPKRFSQVH